MFWDICIDDSWSRYEGIWGSVQSSEVDLVVMFMLMTEAMIAGAVHNSDSFVVL